jgi:hypothetical protein
MKEPGKRNPLLKFKRRMPRVSADFLFILFTPQLLGGH